MAISRCTAQGGWQALAELLTNAKPGDEVHLEPGTYHGAAPLSLPSSVQLVGIDGVVLQHDGPGPILDITGQDCHLSKIAFIGTRPGQICVLIRNAECVRLSECTFDGGGIAEAAVVAESSWAIHILSCSVKGFSPQQEDFPGAISLFNSDGQITKTRCHDNEASGIRFLASTGMAEQNECWGNHRSGIVIQYDPTAPDHPSNVTVRGNRCYENAQAGIVFLASTGQAEQNECWGKQGNGIAVESHPAALDHPSNVTVRGNRCYENSVSGIRFTASTGLAEQNDCWGNQGGSGIHVQSAPNSLDHPSNVTIRGNRCHENGRAGIQFLASTGLAEQNDCWGNQGGSGIHVQFVPDSPDHPSSVTLLGNRCHANALTGIRFTASTGLAEQNDCWGNQGSGILIECDPTAPDHKSDVTLRGNRCHENGLTGIRFRASTGLAEQNECWSNRHNRIQCLDSSVVAVPDHREYPSRSPDDLRKTRLDLHPLRTWLTNPSNIDDRYAEPLADYLHSGGCPKCFARFWEQGIKTSVTSPQAADLAATSSDDRIRTYEMTYTEDRSVNIHRTTIPPERAHPPHTGREGLAAVIGEFCRSVKQGRTISSPPHWTIAFISAETADASTVTTWLNDAKSHTADLEERHFDCSRTAALSNTPAGSGIEQQLLGEYPTWWQRLGARAETLLFMPAQEFLGALAAVGILSFLTLLVVTFQFDPGHWPIPHSYSALVDSLAQVLAQAFDSWSNFTTVGGLVAVWILALQVLLNRNLPQGLRLSTTLPVALVKWLAKPDPIKDLVEALHITPLFTALGRLAHSATSRQFWLLRQVYGYRLFDRLRPGAPTPRLIAFLNVDVPTQQDREDMRLLLQKCPRNQSVVVITQMAGLSMLTSAYIDVWSPQTGDDPKYPPTSYIVHDIDAGMIHPSNSSSIPTDDEGRRVLHDLGRLLGWIAAETLPIDHETTESDDSLNQHGNVLTHEKWAFSELTLALVIGSTPYAHMLVDRSDTSALEQYKEEFLTQLAPYLELFELDGSQLASTVFAETDARVERGVAFLPVKRTRGQSERRRCWVGRGGYRRALGDLVRTWYVYSRQEQAEADEYLAELMMCGEIYHLRYMTSLLATCEPKADLELNRQLGLLHMDAACFLVEERLAMAKNVQESSVLTAQWQSFVTDVLRKEGDSRLQETQRARLCSMFLKIAELYRQKGHDQFGFQEEQELNHVLFHPFERGAATTTFWTAFLNDVSEFLRLLAHRESAVAEQLLTAQFHQEWYALPDAIKQKLKTQSAGFSRDWLDQMGQQTSPETILELVRRLREQAALVVGGLSRLAAAYLRHSPSGSEPSRSLEHIADAVRRLRRAAGDTAPSAAMTPYTRSPLTEAYAAATTLLCEETYLQELCKLLEAGAHTGDMIRSATEMAACAIEGVAIGTHGSLYKALELAKDADEVTLKSRTPASTRRL